MVTCPHTLQAGDIVRLPDNTLGWVHIARHAGQVVVFRAADIDHMADWLACHDPAALCHVNTPVNVTWDPILCAYRCQDVATAFEAVRQLTRCLGIPFEALRQGDSILVQPA